MEHTNYYHKSSAGSKQVSQSVGFTYCLSASFVRFLPRIAISGVITYANDALKSKQRDALSAACQLIMIF